MTSPVSNPGIYLYCGRPFFRVARPGEEDVDPGELLVRAYEEIQPLGLLSLWINCPPAPGTPMAQALTPELLAMTETRNFNCPRRHDILECDGRYETAIQHITQDLAPDGVVAGSSINTISRHLAEHGSDHALAHMAPKVHGKAVGPVASYDNPATAEEANAVRSWYQSFDIWDPELVQTLAEGYRSVLHGRRLKGLWLSLGGAQIWALTNYIRPQNFMYEVATDAAREALGRSEPVDMRTEGQHYGPLIVTRLGRIAADLVAALKPFCRDFYFQTYTIPAYVMRPAFLAAGLPGITCELCERLADLEGVSVHMVVSSAWRHTPDAMAEASRLMQRFPNVEWIGGAGRVGDLQRMALPRLAQGYQAIETSCYFSNPAERAALPVAIQLVRKKAALL